MAQMEPRYERNLPKLCSFFAQGECNRGAECPFRHEMPKDRGSDMAAQSTKNRFYGTSDPVANKILGRKRRQEQEQQQADDDYEKARATLYVRLRGDAPYPELTEEVLRDLYYSYGELVSVKAHADKGQAFVEYTTPEATALAISSTNKKELLGRQLFVAWARASKRGSDDNNSKNAKSTSDGGLAAAQKAAATTCQPVRMLAPPASKPTSTANVKLPPKLTAKLPAGLKVNPALMKRGGGPIRRAGTGNVSSGAAAPYPSANPNRLGTQSKLPPPPSSS
eukprot:scaffold36700_cov176-Amphora_coffeaeformis.AAC.2